MCWHKNKRYSFSHPSWRFTITTAGNSTGYQDLPGNCRVITDTRTVPCSNSSGLTVASSRPITVHLSIDCHWAAIADSAINLALANYP